jgi:uncharacterized delta-60 repeat protein
MRGFRISVAAIGALLLVGAPWAAPGAGILDRHFGSNGKVVADFGGSTIGSSVAIQTNGRIIVGGLSSDSSGDSLILARFGRRGRPDATFGSRGVVKQTLGRSTGALDVALQRDGKIIVAGGLSKGNTSGFLILRLRPDGTPDRGFGSDGIVYTTFDQTPTAAHALLLEPDGKILAAGAGSNEFLLARYNPDGSLDTSFGNSGRATTTIAGSSLALLNAIVADGQTVTAVGSALSHESASFTLARYRQDGSLDPHFGTNGIALTHRDGVDLAQAAAVTPAGKTVVGGSAASLGGTAPVTFALARYDKDGSLDRTFGELGFVHTRVGGSPSTAYALAIQRDGKVVAAGGGSLIKGVDFALARYQSNGALDRTFGRNGVVWTSYRAGDSTIHALALQPNGDIVAAGDVGEGGAPSRVAIARYVGSPVCDVPNVRRMRLKGATQALLKHNCVVGHVSHVFSATIPRGAVVAQSPPARSQKPDGSKVDLALSLGRRQHLKLAKPSGHSR